MEEYNFWKTQRGKALIKLIIWCIFLVIIILFASSGSFESVDKQEMQEEKEVYRFVEYSTMVKQLLKNNYAFKYTITKENDIFIYEGITDGINTLGVKETRNNIIKYYIQDGTTFKLVLNEPEMIYDLYEDIDEKILDLNALFSTLNDIDYQIEKQGDKRIIKYITDETTIEIITTLKEITQITYTKGNEMYNLEFSLLGKIDNISLN